jgi:uncharacterized protein
LHRAQNEFYAGGSDGALRQVLAPNVSWLIPGRNPIAGSYNGLSEVLDYFGGRRQLAAETFQLRRLDVLTGDGDRIAALTDGSAELVGERQDWSTVGLYEVAARRASACWLLPLDPAIFDTIWSL